MGLLPHRPVFNHCGLFAEGLRLSGSLTYHHPHDLMKAIALVEKKVLSPKSIVSHTFPFEKIQEAMQIASKGEAGKIVLDMGK